MAFCALVVFSLRLSGAAQTVTATTGAVNGIVTDSSQAHVPGVTVSLSGPSLMATRTVVTDAGGAYRFSAVPVGDHTLTFELAGFGTIVRKGIHVGVGFTATVNAEMSPGNVVDRITVSGSPVVDLSSTAVTTHFDSEKLASLPGARDIFAILANTPGVALSKMDVGGNTALSLQEYTAYGLRADDRREPQRGRGPPGRRGQRRERQLPFRLRLVRRDRDQGRRPDRRDVRPWHIEPVRQQGRRKRVITAACTPDFQNDALASDQHRRRLRSALGVTGGPGLDARDVNRLQRFRDFTRGRRWLPEKRQGVVVRCLPVHGGRTEIPVAAR